MKLSEILVRSAEAGLALQGPDGAMPAGHNGPRNDSATPVRTSSHWVILFLKAYELTKQEKYRIAARRAADYLVCGAPRLCTGAFECRVGGKKDSCNGLIGQAWALEGLAEAHRVFKDERYGRVACDVFLAHAFDMRACLWHTADGAIDITFNHQLWFALAGVLLLVSGIKNNEMAQQVSRFLRTAGKHISFYPNGIIKHRIAMSWRYRGSAGVLKMLPIGVREFLKKTDYEQAVGYHSFNLYALAAIKTAGYLQLAGSLSAAQIQRSITIASSPAVQAALNTNRYAFPYNPTGLELAYAQQAFGVDVGSSSSLVSEQLKRHFNPGSNLLSRNTDDQDTLAARLYEAARIFDCEVTL